MSNVLFVTKYYYPLKTGAGERIRKMLPFLETNKIKASVFTYSFSSSNENSNNVTRLRKNKVKIKNQTLYLQFKAFVFILKNFRKFDVIYFLHHDIRFSFLIFLIRMVGKKCILGVTMSPSKRTENLWGFKHIYKNIRAYFFYSSFSTVHCLNKYTFSLINEKYYISKSKLKIAKNIIDINRFSPIKDKNKVIQLRKTLELPINKKIILYVGYLNERKGLDTLINFGKSLKEKHKDISLVIIGNVYDTKIFGGDNGRNEILLSKFEKLVDDVSIIHRNYQDNINEYYNCSDLLFHPSKKEGNPNVVLEAMSSGLPVFSTVFEGYSEEIGLHDKNLFLCMSGSKNINYDIMSLLHDEVKKNKFSISSRLIMKKYHKDALRENLELFKGGLN